MTPTQGAILATTGPAGFFVYNKIHYGSILPCRNKKERKNSSSNELSVCSSESSAPRTTTSSPFCCKRKSKKSVKEAAKKEKLELENKTYADFDSKSTSSEIAPPAYSRS